MKNYKKKNDVSDFKTKVKVVYKKKKKKAQKLINKKFKKDSKLTRLKKKLKKFIS